MKRWLKRRDREREEDEGQMDDGERVESEVRGGRQYRATAE